MRKKLISVFLSLTVLCVALSGCGIKKAETVTDKLCKAKENYVPSGVIAEEAGLSLLWDYERTALLIKKNGETVWASMPMTQYFENTASDAVMKYLESSIVVEYVAGLTGSAVATVNSYNGAGENGRIYSYLLKDGIRILYCFDSLYFAIPVEYRLKDGYLDVKIDLGQIYECTNRITKISVLPYAGAVQNAEENRIFVPDGSGMIMKCDMLHGTRTYSGAVYGEDKTEIGKYSFISSANVKLPVYAISDSSGVTNCVIIDKNEASAFINAGAGDTTFGYSYAYTTFNVRGTYTVTIPGSWGSVSVSNQYSDLPKELSIGQRIYFIDGYDPNFVSTADCYRNYLIDNTGLSESNKDASVYLDIPMALQQKEFIFGTPFQSSKSVTSYSEALKIIDDFYTDGADTIVRLKGIQSGGMNVTKIAGGFKTEKALGSLKELSELLKSAEENGVSIFPDFDISRFKKSSSGFRVNNSAACNSTGMKSLQYFYKLSTGVAGNTSFYLLSPTKLVKASDKLWDMLKKYGFNGVSLSTLSSGYYSDYKSAENYIGAGYADAVNTVSKNGKSNDFALMYENANQYAAVNASYIVDAPLSTSEYDAEDYWLPFYQMVFKGYVPMSSGSINLADNGTTEFLRAIQTGVGLKFTVCGTETAEYANSDFPELIAGSYENSEEYITELREKGQSTVMALANAKIINFVTVADGVCKTDFDNGCAVVVNYTDNDFDYAGKTVLAHGYVLVREDD